MIFDPTLSNLHHIWNTFTDFEGFNRESDCDLNHFIEEWKEKMAKAQSSGCQYSELVLGLKLIEKANLNHDCIVSLISKLSSSTCNSENFLTFVLKNIKEEYKIERSTEIPSLGSADIIKTNKDDQEIAKRSEELVINCKMICCSECPVKFLDEDSLSKHYLNSHPDKIKNKDIHSKMETRSDSGFLKCPICGKNFMFMETLQKHISLFHGHGHSKFGSDCDSYTDQELDDSSELVSENPMDAITLTPNLKKEVKIEKCKEINNEKGHGKAFMCRICFNEYPKFWLLNRHMKVHKTTKDYKCSHCDNTYKWACSLKLHLLSTHLQEQTNNNSTGAQVVRNSSKKCAENRIIHSNSKKSSSTENKQDSSAKIKREEKMGSNVNLDKKKTIKTLPCEICGKSFSKYSLKRHIEETHLAKIHKCDNCPREFAKLSVLERHMKTHNTIHECNVCQKTFKTSTQLRLHMDVHKTTRDLICTYCGKKYKSYSVLKEHLNLHTKARTMPCNFCDKVFFDYTSRKFHVRRYHTGEKPYKCDFCEKSFFTSTKKVDHMRTHTGEKPFPCHVCGKFFRETNTLRKHIKNVHKIANASDM